MSFSTVLIGYCAYPSGRSGLSLDTHGTGIELAKLSHYYITSDCDCDFGTDDQISRSVQVPSLLPSAEKLAENHLLHAHRFLRESLSVARPSVRPSVCRLRCSVGEPASVRPFIRFVGLPRRRRLRKRSRCRGLPARPPACLPACPFIAIRVRPSVRHFTPKPKRRHTLSSPRGNIRCYPSAVVSRGPVS